MITTLSLPMLSAIIAFLAALLASVLTHFLTAWRDSRNEQRRQRATILLSAFLALLSASNRPRLHEVGPQVERATAELQALGTAKLVALTQEFVKNLIAQREAPIDPLLAELRTFLRKELGVEPTESPIVWLRIEAPKDDV